MRRLGDEALAAFGAAEQVLVTLMLGAMRGRGRINAHAANRIARLRISFMVMMGVMRGAGAEFRGHHVQRHSL